MCIFVCSFRSLFSLCKEIMNAVQIFYRSRAHQTFFHTLNDRKECNKRHIKTRNHRTQWTLIFPCSKWKRAAAIAMRACIAYAQIQILLIYICCTAASTTCRSFSYSFSELLHFDFVKTVLDGFTLVHGLRVECIESMIQYRTVKYTAWLLPLLCSIRPRVARYSDWMENLLTYSKDK